MKAYIVATIFLSTILMSFVDTDFDSYTTENYDLQINDSSCGSQTFSKNVKSAFKKESDLNQYSPSQIYLTKEWVVVLNSPYCNQPLSNFIDEKKVEEISDFSILSGTWIIEFQTGDVAFTHLSNLDFEGYLWAFYPLTEKPMDLRFTPNDYDLSKQWYIEKNRTNGVDLNVKDVWSDYTGEGIVIGVVDDGVDYNHPEIDDNFVYDYSKDFCDNDEDVMPDSTDWHGTAIAGIAAGEGNNTIGIAGVAYDSNIAGIRLVSDTCGYTWEDENYTLNDLAISEALIHELDNIDIYTNSWGPKDDGDILGYMGPLTISALERGISEGRDGLGAIYVWSNGNGLNKNDFSNKDEYANSRYTIAVGAVNWEGKQTTYSETGPNVLVSAPSYDIPEVSNSSVYTTDIVGENGATIEDYTSVAGGTSVAAPMVAGVVALMLEANPDLTWRDVQHILIKSTKKIDGTHPGWFPTVAGREYNNAYGYGRIDAKIAVNYAKEWVNVEDEVNVRSDKIEVEGYILDENNEGVTSSLFIDRSINIESVEILVNITHGDRGDLNVFLISPNGIISELVRENELDINSNYHNWTFTSVKHWGENSFGEWSLKVNDTVFEGDDNRMFNNWSITFYGTPEPDQDGDGLPDYADLVMGTGVFNPDFDADNLLDGEEYYGWTDFKGNFHKTDPKIRDTDADGLTDFQEGFDEIFNPLTNDTDVTDPNNNDTDGDGLLDGEELDDDLKYYTNPLLEDTDGDTLTDYEEIFAYDLYGRSSSDPNSQDGDNDGMPDLYELNNDLNPMKTADAAQDADCDGFGTYINTTIRYDYCEPVSQRYTNLEEYLAGTDPNNSDSDSDGLPDGWEHLWGLDPLIDDRFDDHDNDTLLNIYEYDNRMIENTLFSLNEITLKGYWKFDGTDPTSAINMVPGSDMAIVLNGAERVSGKFLNGIKCDGVDDYVRLDSLDNSKFTEYTVQSWVKLDNFSSEFSTVVGTVQDGRTWLGINEENIFEFKVFSGNKIHISPITNDSIQAKLGVWYHLAATYSETNSVLKLYVNGTLISEESIDNPSIKTATNYNYICRGQNEGEYLNGTIDHIAIWNRALTSDEIFYVFKKPKGFGNAYSYFRIDDDNHHSNPNSTDTDNDGLSDREEAYFGLDGYITDITNPDTDGDTITDYDEFIIYQTSPLTNDTDGDNYTDNYEFKVNETTGLRINQTGDAFPLDPSDWNDTDGDKLGDNTDAFPLNSSEQYDTDGDFLGDNYENYIGTDPENADTDSDGTNDSIDAFPLDSEEYLDTDGDGVGDNADECPEDKRDYIDTDGDDVCDKSDPFPDNPNEWKDSDKDGIGDNSDAFPTDPTKSLDHEEVKLEPQIEGNFDSSMLVIIALGAVYFLFKKFTK